MTPRLAPMKATPGPLPTGDDWAYEIKWDGMRALAAVSDTVALWSSRGNEIGHRFPELDGLVDACAGLDVVLDGEIVALDETGLPDFGRLQARMHLDRAADVERRRRDTPVVYVVFDLLHLDGTDTVALSYDDRRRLLARVLQPGDAWQCATVHLDDGPALLHAVAERGMEGIVAKRRSSPYTPGRRSADWVKVKVRRHQELVVGGWLSGEGDRRTSVAALLVGYQDDEGLRFAGRVGSGLTDDEARRLRDVLAPLTVAASPFVDPVAPVRGRTITFVEPAVVVEVAFAEWTTDGNLRHPVYLGRRDDVDPDAVTREPDPSPEP